MDVFQQLTASNNPVVAILSGLVIVLSGVVVIQWRYAIQRTVPKWVWDRLTKQIDDLLKAQEPIRESLKVLIDRKK